MVGGEVNQRQDDCMNGRVHGKDPQITQITQKKGKKDIEQEWLAGKWGGFV